MSSSASRSSIFSGGGSSSSAGTLPEGLAVAVGGVFFSGRLPAGDAGDAGALGVSDVTPARGVPQKSVFMRFMLFSVMERITSSCCRMILSFLSIG